MLRLVICHLEVFALKDHDLLVEFRVFEAFQKLEYVLAFALEQIMLFQCVDNLVLIYEYLFDGLVVSLNEDV